jgi:hypothetical protein
MSARGAGRKVQKSFENRARRRFRMDNFSSEKAYRPTHKRFIQKPIDRSSGFDRFILHPETGEMVQFETSALALA